MDHSFSALGACWMRDHSNVIGRLPHRAKGRECVTVEQRSCIGRLNQCSQSNGLGVACSAKCYSHRFRRVNCDLAKLSTKENMTRLFVVQCEARHSAAENMVVLIAWC